MAEKINFTPEELASLGAPMETQESEVQTPEVVEPVIEDTESHVIEEPAQEEKDEDPEPVLVIQETKEEPKEEPKSEPKTQKVKKQIYKDGFQAALNNYYNTAENPDVEMFTRAYFANYDNLSPEEVIRQEILSDPFNKGLRPTAIAKLVKDRLSKYELDAEDPDDRADAEDLLRREAEIVKARMMKAGKDLISQYSSDLEIEVDAPVEEQRQPTEDELKAQRDALVAQYSPEVEKYVKNGVIQIQDKDTLINIPASEAQVYIDALVDPVEFLRSLALNPDGTVNIGKFIQFVTAAKNTSKYNSAMIAHGVQLGQSKLASKIKNEAPIGQPRPADAGLGYVDPVKDPNGFAEALKYMKPYNRV